MKASCHCGNVTISAEKPPEVIITCTCSICRRLGAMWGHYTSDQVELKIESEPTVFYIWGDRLIEFHYCPRCSCSTHHTHSENYEGDRFSINCRMADPKDIEGIPVKCFDGADTWQFID